MHDGLAAVDGMDEAVDAEEGTAEDHDHEDADRGDRFDRVVVGEFSRHDHFLFLQKTFDLFEIFLTGPDLLALLGEFGTAAGESRLGILDVPAEAAEGAGLTEEALAMPVDLGGVGILGVAEERRAG